MTRIANSAKFDVKVLKLLNHIHLGGQLRVDLVQVEDGVALPARLLPHHRQHHPHLVGQTITLEKKKNFGGSIMMCNFTPTSTPQ